MRNLYSLLVIVLITFHVVAQNPNPNTDLDDFILEEMEIENAPGMSTLIVKGGEIVWVESYGWADIESGIAVEDSTVFMLASVSKVFTGTALMLLHENGQMDLDLDINRYLPFTIDVPNFIADSITGRMLMTHTASIADNDLVMDTYYSNGDPTISLADLIERYFTASGSDYNPNANFLNNAPGTVYNYSNMGTALAGYVVESASGIDFSEFCNQFIFNALCMENTSWYFADFDSSKVARPYQWTGSQYQPYAHYGFADYPDGQLRSNVLDLANFLIAFLQEGSFQGVPLITSSSVDEMLSSQVPAIEPGQGLNWYTEELYLSGGGTATVWGHNGGESGVTSDIYIDPTTEIGIAVLANGEGDNLYVVDELYNYALTLSTAGVGNPPCEAMSTPIAENKTTVHIYPNPSNGIIQLHTDRKVKGELTVYNALGQAIQTLTIQSQQTLVELNEPGVYYFHVAMEDEALMVSKVLVM